MNAKILIAGVAIVALAAGGASAKTHHKKMHRGHKTEAASESKYAAPDQPIPYAQLDSYIASHGMAGGDNDKMAKTGRGSGKMRHHHMKSSSTMPSDTSAAPSDMAPATPPATDTPSTPPQ
jgi:hypothetical protein